MYREVGMDNINYLLGANPFDISFVTGCGDRNLQHPHHRASNPDGYDQNGNGYAYTKLTGAVLGGVKPGKTLKDEWMDYDVTETCIDFSSQAIFPLMLLSGGEEIPTGTTRQIIKTETHNFPTNKKASIYSLRGRKIADIDPCKLKTPNAWKRGLTSGIYIVRRIFSDNTIIVEKHIISKY